MYCSPYGYMERLLDGSIATGTDQNMNGPLPQLSWRGHSMEYAFHMTGP